MVRWPWQQPKSPARQAFAIGAYCLLLGAVQLATLPGSTHILMWARLLSGLLLMIAGVSQVRRGVTLRRKRRRELLRAVATAMSALGRHRREELGSGQC
jgi:uncharacterized membrane protein